MLGRQQIAGIPTAISELFKNAHDAYADFADVDFFRKDDILVLRDDGIGMTEEEFLNRWLAIGTESKVGASVGLDPPPKPKNKKGRPMLGEKGIGRLAIAAIGPQVLILTRAIRDNKQQNIVAAFINWGIFESPGLNLDQIEIPVLPYESGTLPTRGDVTALVDLFRDNLTTLKEIIPSNLAVRISSELQRFKIDPQALDRFLKGISKPTLTDNGQGTHFLIQPTNETLIADIDGEDTAATDTSAAAPPIVQRLIGFSNTMTDELVPVITTAFRDHKPLQPFVDLISPKSFFTPDEFKTADHHFRGAFDEFGQFNGTVAIYKKDPVEHTLPWTAGKGAPTKCGRFKINLAYVQGKPHESLLPPDDWARITGKLNKIGGLYIYRNGIRVLPYGSSDYDFLELERQRSKKASTGFFSYRRMFGFIEITAKENPDLNEKAGREGFRENAAYREFRGILKNFFLQMANDFFRESGLYADVFVEGKGQLQRENEARRARDLKAKEARKQFASDLDRFFEDIETGNAGEETTQLLNSVSQQIERAFQQREQVAISTALIELEGEVRDQLHALRKRFTVAKPRAVGLTPALSRDWKVYEDESRRIEYEILEPAERKIQESIANAFQRNPPITDLPREIRKAFQERASTVQEALQTKTEATRTEAANINRQIEHLIENSAHAVQNVIRNNHDELNKILKSAKDEGLVLGEYYRLEALTIDRANREFVTLDNLTRRLRQAVDSTSNADDIIEALEEENLALFERSEAEVELTQLGMAVSAIGHEFRHTVSSIRNNLNKLKGWADVNKDLRELWRSIRADFDHLDAYLELFTPLQQRLFRKKVAIRGSGIEDYLRKLFGDRLKRENVDLNVSNTFRRMVLDGYPSTFYPVFVNLVDNSLYWLKDRSGPKNVNLDMEGGSTLIISDNGPGVPKRDREAIFQRGFTRKPGGRGMGLAISREVLAREGRDLILDDSPPGAGAVFKIKSKPPERRT